MMISTSDVWTEIVRYPSRVPIFIIFIFCFHPPTVKAGIQNGHLWNQSGKGMHGTNDSPYGYQRVVRFTSNERFSLMILLNEAEQFISYYSSISPDSAVGSPSYASLIYSLLVARSFSLESGHEFYPDQ